MLGSNVHPTSITKAPTSPCPRRNDSRSDEATLYSPSCGREDLGGLKLIVVAPQHEGDEHHADCEETADSNDHAITGSCAKGSG